MKGKKKASMHMALLFMLLSILLGVHSVKVNVQPDGQTSVDVTLDPLTNLFAVLRYIGSRLSRLHPDETADSAPEETEQNEVPEPVPPGCYRIRRTWEDAAGQLSAYNDPEVAKENCPAGFHVYAADGTVIYSG